MLIKMSKSISANQLRSKLFKIYLFVNFPSWLLDSSQQFKNFFCPFSTTTCDKITLKRKHNKKHKQSRQPNQITTISFPINFFNLNFFQLSFQSIRKQIKQCRHWERSSFPPSAGVGTLDYKKLLRRRKKERKKEEREKRKLFKALTERGEKGGGSEGAYSRWLKLF